MKKGDTVRVVSTFSAPGQDEVPQGSQGRLCAINEYDKIGTVDLGDSMPVIPLDLLKVVDKKIPSKPKKDSVGLRDNSGKPQVHQVPWELLEGVSEALMAGEGKYPKWNWRKPKEWSAAWDSAQRHMWKFWSGEDLDQDLNIHHLKLAATNLAMLLYHIKHNPDMDDRPKRSENE